MIEAMVNHCMYYPKKTGSFGYTRAEMKMKELTNTGMVEVYNHQYLWDNRQLPKIHQAFADIWGTEKLWVTIDRANLNFPIRPGHEYKGFIHWDYDPETKPQNVQGVLALADQTGPNMGGFQCVPELYRTYNTWKLSQPQDRDHFKPDTTGLEIVKVPMEAGDLLIFNSTQPHGIRANTSGNKVRMAQYISMMPAEEENDELREWRVSSWKEEGRLKVTLFLETQENGNRQSMRQRNSPHWAKSCWVWINGNNINHGQQ